MKLFLFIGSFLLSIHVFAIDRFVDPNLSTGNGTTLFTTISSAVGAAVNGDRILIVPGTYNEPTLTISKSLTLLSQTLGSRVNYNGNFTIAGFPGMKLEILGFDLGIYSITANKITGGSGSSRAKVSVVDSKMTNLTIDQDFYELNCARTRILSKVTFRFGNFIISRADLLYLNDESGKNLSGQKNLIAADTIDSRIELRNDDFPVIVANNILGDLFFWKWNNELTNTNFIRNNKFVNDIKLIVADEAPSYNIEFSSNEFIGIVNFPINNFSCTYSPRPSLYDGYECTTCGCEIYSKVSSNFPRVKVKGFFKWTYNGIDLPCAIPSSSDPLVLTKIIGQTGTNINTGNPNHDYYDIDLTINDRGITGGPYSVLNYNPTINPSNGKAFIFDIEMPTDIYSGQKVDIKAKGYHKN